MIDPLQVGDVLEHKWIVYGDLTTDPLVHGVDEGLVDGHALLGQGRRVVYGDLVELGVRGPVLVEDEQELLSTPQGEDWDQTPTTPRARYNNV